MPYLNDDETYFRQTAQDGLKILSLFDAPTLEVMKHYLAIGVDPNEERELGRTPLGMVSSVKAAALLCAHGAKVSGNRWTTPLHCQQHWEVCRYLLEHGADVNALNHYQQTPLHCATDPAIAKLLLDHGAEVNRQDLLGRSALHEAESAEMVRLLLKYGAQINSVSRNGCTPLETVHDGGALRELARHGGKVLPKRNSDLLHRTQDLECLELLFHCGARPNMVNSRGQNALFESLTTALMSYWQEHWDDCEAFFRRIEENLDLRANQRKLFDKMQKRQNNQSRFFSEQAQSTALPKVPMGKFLMDREKDRIGNLSVDTRRVTTENAPIRDFREVQKEPVRLLTVPSQSTVPPSPLINDKEQDDERDLGQTGCIEDSPGTGGNAGI